MVNPLLPLLLWLLRLRFILIWLEVAECAEPEIQPEHNGLRHTHIYVYIKKKYKIKRKGKISP